MDILRLFNKYKEIILYLFFGVLSTIVSFGTYYLCSNIMNIHYLISNVISWIFAVAFAYVTNRIWVFKSKINTTSEIIKEMITFVNCRLLSGVIDMIIMFILIDMLYVYDLYSKLVTQFIVVILNYIFSKLIIFKNNIN